MDVNTAATETLTGKTVALRCWCSNENYNADFDWAVVKLTPELVETIRRRREMFTSAYAGDNHVIDLRFWDSAPDYTAESDLERFAKSRVAHVDGNGRFESWFESIQDGSEVEAIPETFSQSDDAGNFRTECDRMVVTDDGVYWTCIPRHSSLRVDTAELTYEDVGLQGVSRSRGGQ